MQIRFAASSSRHRVSRESVRYVLATTEPAEVRTHWGTPGLLYIGRDHGGRELEIMAVEHADTPKREGFLLMPNHPVITEDTPFGPDVDLEAEEIFLADGTRLTDDLIPELVDEIRRGVLDASLTEEERELVAAFIVALRHGRKRKAG